MFPLKGVVCLLAGGVIGMAVTLLVLAETGSWPGSLLAGMAAAGGVIAGLPLLLDSAKD